MYIHTYIDMYMYIQGCVSDTHHSHTHIYTSTTQTLLTHELLDPDRVVEESNRHTGLHIGAMKDHLPLVELLIGYNVRGHVHDHARHVIILYIHHTFIHTLTYIYTNRPTSPSRT
jgi:hypothetical protein